MIAATAPITAITVITQFKGCSRQSFANQREKRLKGGGYTPTEKMRSPGSLSMTCQSQCFAFQRCHQFMFALSAALDGCVGTSIVAQGRAGTPSLHLAVVRLHAASVISSGMARNVQI
ncbi:hypothetical protein [Comamonas kerstersii]|uniref:hypothetical protein n=1 Tax=Comamonas kerstersii TaxID=225992 RepID=UPI001B334EA1|nr:hypothetical protein [Comamonas kerstersii]QTW20221.1 hypothetical protein H8N02_07340 [Comamonas kerstersii]